MHKQMGPNLVPCFFLRFSFILSSYQKRENRKVVRKQNARRDTGRTKESQFNQNYGLPYTVMCATI